MSFRTGRSGGEEGHRTRRLRPSLTTLCQKGNEVIPNWAEGPVRNLLFDRSQRSRIGVFANQVKARPFPQASVWTVTAFFSLTTETDVVPNRVPDSVRNLLFDREKCPMPEEKVYYVYILASRSRALYVGVTGFLMARVLRHRAGEASDFTRKYRIHGWCITRFFTASQRRSPARRRSRSGDGRRKWR